MEQPDREKVERELRDLARRVARIEQQLSLAEPQTPAALPAAPPASPSSNHAPSAETAQLIPVLGRSMLGLAGAYLLRTLTESGAMPLTAGVMAGIVYAIVWLAWAARTPAEKRVEAALLSLTSVLVLSPLLWEATLRFQAVSTGTAAAILFVFTFSGLAVSWGKDVLVVATIATLAGLGTSAALLMATHDVLPFTFVFLAIAAAVEASACLNHWLSERWLTAAAANLSVLLATWLVTDEHGLPPSYAPIPNQWLLAAQVTLVTIYLGSIVIRTLARGFTFTGFETAQCAAALLIGVGGGLRLSNQAAPIGAMVLACSAVCYLVSFLVLERRGGGHSRNFYTYATFAFLLAVAGTRILLPGIWAPLAWTVLMAASLWAGGRFGRQTLQWHGFLYLLLALGWSGALRDAGAVLLATVARPNQFGALLGAALAVALAGYALARRGAQAGKASRNRWVFDLLVVAVLVWIAAGVLAGALTAGYHAAFGASAPDAYCATLRTGVLAAAGLTLAWAGARWNHPGVSRLTYPVMLLATYRLLTQDLYQDLTAARFLSLLLCGGALTALPRLRRERRFADAE